MNRKYDRSACGETNREWAGAATRDAYRQAVNEWTGCDWQTEFGRSRLDLNGVKAAHAVLLAQATAGSEAADWRAAMKWLEQVEADAAAAAAEGNTAAELAETGRLTEALEHARRACDLESKYHSPRVWNRLLDTVEASLVRAAD